jgi:hypothetical protein
MVQIGRVSVPMREGVPMSDNKKLCPLCSSQDARYQLNLENGLYANAELTLIMERALSKINELIIP